MSAAPNVGVVVDSVSIVVIREGVHCSIDGEGGCGGGGGRGGGGGGGGGRRLRSGSGDILLGGLLCWNRLHRGWDSGVVVVVRGSVVGGGVGVGFGVGVVDVGVVVDALFVGGDFLV